jgi:Ca-activated chloride channel family protein
MLNLKFTALKNGLKAGFPQTFHLLLRISSPQAERPSEKRSPLNIALVIDKSGSMAGEPLNQAKRAASMILDRLADDDRLSVVAYDQNVEVPVPLMQIRGSRREIERAIGSIDVGGTTALYDGWHAGAEELRRTTRDAEISRVMLLSDGCANVGLTDATEITQHCARMANSGITTSTYGLGLHFNEILMSQMAETGHGRPYYGQTAEDLMDPFEEEFELLDALIARNLRLHLTPEPGVRFKVLNLYRQDDNDAYILPDLACAGEVWALLEVDVCDEALVAQRGQSVRVLTAHTSYQDRDGVPYETDQEVLWMQTLGEQEFERLADDQDVQARLVEIRVSQMQAEAAEAARQGNWSHVDELIAKISETGHQNAWITASIRRLQDYAMRRNGSAFSKEAHHKASSMRNRMVSHSESVESWSASAEDELPRYLRRKLERGRRHKDD